MNRRYYRYVHTLFIVLPMTILMALVGLARNYGFGEGWPVLFFRAWIVMFPIAYVAVLFIVPTAKKVGSSRVDLQACKLEYSIVSPK